MIRATNIKRGLIVSKGLMHIRLEDVPHARNAILREGEIVVVRSGAYTGDSALVTAKWAGSVAGYDLIVSPADSVDSAYLSFWLLGEIAHTYFRGQRDRSAQPHINRQQLSDAELTLPSLHEQHQITAVLSAVQKAIVRQERLIALTTELKKAIMHKLFTEGTRGEPLKQTEIGPVPGTWTESCLGTVARFSSGGTPSREASEYWTGGTISWVKTAEVNYYTIAETEERITQAGLDNSSAKIFPVGTLLMAMYGQGMTRGRVGILGIAAATNQACAAVMPHSEEEVSTIFLYYFLEFHYENLRQRGHGANQTNLSMTLLKNFPVYFPSRREQQMIIAVLRAVDHKVEIHKQEQKALTALFRTLLHQLMTAQIRVHDFDLSLLEEVGHRPEREDIFAEMHTYMVDVENLNDTRDAVYTRGEGVDS